MKDSEYATDVLFHNPESLARIYPALIDHAVAHFHCRDVLRFLGRRINSRFSGEIVSNVKHRVEGVHIKHWVEENSIKMYDKAGSVLRIETTINNPQRFKVRHQQPRCRLRYALRDHARLPRAVYHQIPPEQTVRYQRWRRNFSGRQPQETRLLCPVMGNSQLPCVPGKE